MEMSEVFIEAVNSQNIHSIRAMMKNNLLFDPSFSVFTEMEKAAGSVSGLYDIHDGKDFENDRSKWNDDYLSTVLNDLMYNFSHDRIDHVKSIVRYLKSGSEAVRSDNGENKEKQSRKETSGRMSYEESKHRYTHRGSIFCKETAVGAAIGAVVLGTAASVVTGAISGTVLCAAAGAVIGGAAGNMIKGMKS